MSLHSFLSKFDGSTTVPQLDTFNLPPTGRLGSLQVVAITLQIKGCTFQSMLSHYNPATVLIVAYFCHCRPNLAIISIADYNTIYTNDRLTV